MTTGSVKYHLWMSFLTLLMLCGAYAYSIQIREGLSVTGMSDSVSWGLYISNFTFLVGVAAAAVMNSTRPGSGRRSSSLAPSSVDMTIGAPHICVTP